MNLSDEQKIPALPMWKIFSHTVPNLYNINFKPEDNVQALTRIINSEELSNILVFSPLGHITIDEYNMITAKYKSFTIWLIGRFFYFLSCDHLAR